MKYEWRKKDKKIYMPGNEPTFIDLPKLKYVSIEGVGNPNSDSFQDNISALYTMSYGIKMSPKKGVIIEDYFDYTVFPLEAFWSLSEKGKSLYLKGEKINNLKDYFTYKAMIRQPVFVTNQLFESTRDSAIEKKKNSKILNTKLEYIEEGLCCQILHIGTYDKEFESFKKMEEFCDNNGYTRISEIHKEIYISDPRRVTPDRLKTTLRFKVIKNDK